MIEKWTILNLPCREDRRYISTSGALRMQVPEEKIRFWHGYDIADFENFEQAEEAVRQDMPELLNIEEEVRFAEQGKFLMLWNVARYLRELASKNRIEAFVHDGLMLVKEFCPSFAWFEDVVGEIISFDPNFKMLTVCPNNGWYGQLKKIDPITPSSFITRGVLSWDNFARVYSSAGAEVVLARIKTQTWSARANSVLVPRHEDTEGWAEGFYSTILPLGSDYPNAWLGSNSMPEQWQGMRDDFKRLFSEAGHQLSVLGSRLQEGVD